MKIFRFIIVLFAIIVANSTMAQEKIDPWPWDFPQDVKVNVELGQAVLSCDGMYLSAIEKNEDLTKKVLIWYNTEVDKVGDGKVSLAKFGETHEVPNALVVPLKKGQKAKKGDILLTWWQGGSGMERAIVIDDKTPTEPTAIFLDLSWPDDPNDPKIEEKSKGRQLIPNSFNVMKDGEWVSGAQVAYRQDGEWKSGILMHATDDKVLLSIWSSKLTAVDKSVCKLIPFNEKIKKGEKVWCEWLDYYRPGYIVEKVDQKTGHIWVKKEGSERIECMSIAQVTKVLD